LRRGGAFEEATLESGAPSGVFEDAALESGAPGFFDPVYAGVVASEDAYLRAIQQVGATRIRTANNQIHPTLEILAGDAMGYQITRGPTDGNNHRSLTLTPDGGTVISGAGNGVLTSYDVASGKPLWDFKGHTGDVWAVAPSPDGRWMVSGSTDQTVRLWEIATGKLLLTIFPASDGEWVAWTPAGYYTASLNGDRLIGWHINQGEDKLARYYPAERFAGQFRKPRVVAWYLATGGALDKAIALANAELPEEPIRRTEEKDLPTLAPPLVVIALPLNGSETDHSPLNLIAVATSINAAPVERMWVEINGRRLEAGKEQFRVEEGGRRWRLALPLMLTPGENRIAVYASNQYARSEPEEARVFCQGACRDAIAGDKPNLYLLAVGVSDYQVNGLDLNYADDDAKAIQRIIKKQEGELYGAVKVKILTDKEASEDGIQSGLDWLLDHSTERDLSVIFPGRARGEGRPPRYLLLPALGCGAQAPATDRHQVDGLLGHHREAER